MTNQPPVLTINAFVISGLFAAFIAVLVFVVFGRLGFNLVDEGHILAASRRLIDGQFPYLDFIWIRPPLSSLLHAPEVLLGGDHVLILSRLIAGLQIAAIVWLGVSMISKDLIPQKSIRYHLAMLLIAYLLTGAKLFYWAWATLDGVLLLIVGAYLFNSKDFLPKILGFFFIGSACLTKQVFIFAIPIFLVLYGAWRDWRLITAALMPGTIFVLFLLANGAFPDAFLQMVAVGEGKFAKIAVKNFSALALLGFFTGVAATIFQNSKKNAWKTMGIIVVAVLLLLMAVLIELAGWLYSQLPFGAAAGVIVARFCLDKTFLRNLAALLVISWISSLSLGSPYPAWLGGILGIAVFMASADKKPTAGKNLAIDRLDQRSSKAEWTAIVTVMIVSLAVFVEGRLNYFNYKILPTSYSEPLDGKFPGAAGLLSSPAIIAALSDLQIMVDYARESGKKFSIVPEFAAWWIAAPEENPLPLDWPLNAELGNNNPELVHQLMAAADALRPETYFIVQKFVAPSEMPGLVVQNKLPNFWWENQSYPIVGHIRRNYELHKENKHFWLYK